ncbi:MAG: hypothetical protein IPI76_08115 [Chloracidobacterium sp.]|nr:hypothetical protein [Chloracidobacterium sp.]MBK7801280.1 hypothetical protein [Chloracidobacterium sp.]MBK9767497.1 hypothetical protein [Chloracidobacterium sp.]
MTPKGKREIVVEYEQIRLIRKRARTALAHCDKCGTEADFVRLTDAAELFETNADNIFKFANGSGHFRAANGGDITLCLPSLLAAMRSTTKQIKMIGDQNDEKTLP